MSFIQTNNGVFYYGDDGKLYDYSKENDNIAYEYRTRKQRASAPAINDIMNDYIIKNNGYSNFLKGQIFGSNSKDAIGRNLGWIDSLKQAIGI